MKNALMWMGEIATWPHVWVLAFAFFLACCFTPQAADNGARTGLNVLTDVVSPASKLARQGCDAREALIVSQVEVDKNFTAAQGKEKVREIRERCDAIRKTFDTIRDLHNEAALLVEQGLLEQALQKLDEARAQFRGLAPQLEEP